MTPERPAIQGGALGADDSPVSHRDLNVLSGGPGRPVGLSRLTVLALAEATALLFVAALAGCGGAGVAAKATGCLRSHGWKVEQLSGGVFVATRSPYALTYGSSGVPAFGPAPGWNGGPAFTNGRKIHFACFPNFWVSLHSGGSIQTRP
jgi:hypothetical protein